MNGLERLIDFVFSNVYLLIIVVGFLFSLLSKMRRTGDPGGGGQGPSSGKPGPNMPSFGGGSMEERRKQEARPSRGMSEASRPSPGYAGEGISAEYAEEPRRSMSAARTPVSSSANAQRLEFNDLNKEELSAHEAMRGMIWVEILSPPRAKRPYNRKR